MSIFYATFQKIPRTLKTESPRYFFYFSLHFCKSLHIF
nr:MAG TPA: hypothetical protein [Caudoviricetes sp.]